MLCYFIVVLYSKLIKINDMHILFFIPIFTLLCVIYLQLSRREWVY